MVKAHDQEIKVSNPRTVLWIYVSDFIKEKLKINEAIWGTSKKIFKKEKKNTCR